MLTGKQRSYLRAKANKLDPIFQIGKGGINESFIEQVDGALETQELIKINILQNSFVEPKEAIEELTKATGAEYVQTIGSKIIIYRESKKNKKIELPR